MKAVIKAGVLLQRRRFNGNCERCARCIQLPCPDRHGFQHVTRLITRPWPSEDRLIEVKPLRFEGHRAHANGGEPIHNRQVGDRK